MRQVEQDEATHPPGAPQLSIVVLPFVNLSSDPEHGYFADGITDDLTTDLSRIAGSFVIARNTAFTYKGKSVDVKQVGRDLGVRYVLEGSVRRTGEQVRVNVQLIDAESRRTSVGGSLRHQSRRPRSGAGRDYQPSGTHPNCELVVAAFSQIERRVKISPDARDLVMRGWAWWHRPTTKVARQEARRAFERALALEPDSIDAKIGLAATISQILVEGWSGSIQSRRGARRAAVAAKSWNAMHSTQWAGAIMGLLRRIQNRLSEAQAEVEIAIALDRNNELALKQLGQILLFQGEPQAAIPHLEKAIRLNPRGPICGAFNGRWRNAI